MVVVGGVWGGIPVHRVVAVLARLDTGLVQIGSGYLVTGRLILTSTYCVTDARTGRPATSLRVTRLSDGPEVPATLVAGGPEADAAVLAIGEDRAWPAPDALEPPRFGRADRRHSAELRDCRAIGFPLWQLDPGDQGLNAAELHGTIRVAERSEGGLLVMRDPLLNDVAVPKTASIADRASGSPWGGLPGALVFWRELALGLITEHRPQQAGSAITIAPAEDLATGLSGGDRRGAAVISPLWSVLAGPLPLAGEQPPRGLADARSDGDLPAGAPSAPVTAADEADNLAGHAFISYVREDSAQVDRLQRTLQAAGIPVWRDTADLWPGEDWRAKIRSAITGNALVFIACFSWASLARSRSYQNEELTLAIEQLRLRSPDEPWLIPVRLDDCEIPDRDIGGGRTLTSIQRADLFADSSGDNAGRLVATILRILRRHSGNELKPRYYPRRAESAGYLPRGLRIDGKRELLAVLARWLTESTAPTIGDVGSFGRTGWLRVDISGTEVVLNADTKRAAVSAYVRASAADPDRPWLVVASRGGHATKVLPGPGAEPAPGWYAYLKRPGTPGDLI
jgi:hypothetical protein